MNESVARGAYGHFITEGGLSPVTAKLDVVGVETELPAAVGVGAELAVLEADLPAVRLGVRPVALLGRYLARFR